MQAEPAKLKGKGTAAFLVCGLGSLGQHCVALLGEFGVGVNAIELRERQIWDIPDLPDRVNTLLLGDCRQPRILEQGGVRSCRTVLIVTSNERINIETAFAVRSLNPTARLVVRSAQENLNELLMRQLGNFVAFEATQLPVTAFALSALGGETRGFFNLESHLLRVVRLSIGADHRWCDRRLYELNSSTRRILSHTPLGKPTLKGFYQWEPDALIQAGDTVVYLETATGELAATPATPVQQSLWQQWLPHPAEPLRKRLGRLWQNLYQNQTQRVGLISGLIMLVLFLVGTLLYKLAYPSLGWNDALNLALVLAIGGFDNVFGQLQLSFTIPWWLYLYSVGLTVAGTVFIGILYAMLTERVLASQFQFMRRRPPVPRQDHAVVVGMGRVGQKIAHLLQDLRQPVVAIHSSAIEVSLLPQLPLVTGSPTTALRKVNLTTARSVLAVTDDEVANLEIALTAYSANPQLNLVIRAFDPLFAENISRLLPYARVLGAYALAAEAFVAAAFGENVLELFRLHNQTILVTEYQVETGDTLHDRLLAEVAYGYGVVPVLHQKGGQETPKLMPSDDICLQGGDRLVVLATINGLRRVEQSIPFPRRWLVQVERTLSPEAGFEGGMAIARITGCDIRLARHLISQLPGTLDFPLYRHQAQRLVRELTKVQVLSRLVPLANGNPN